MNLFHFLQFTVSYTVTRLTIILIITLPIAYMMIVLLFRRVWEHKKKLLLLQTIHENEILKARVETQEQTFRNMSNDIHNNIGQELCLAHVLIEGVMYDKGIDTKHITKIMQKAISDLRDLSHSISGDIIAEEGLEAAIRQDVDLLNKHNRLEAEFYQRGPKVKIDTDTAIILYRVFQEAVQNVLKHAQAKLVSTMIIIKDEALIMTIEDNGAGFAPDACEGYGIRNMRSRLKLINGNMEIESQPGHTVLYIKIPLDK